MKKIIKQLQIVPVLILLTLVNIGNVYAACDSTSVAGDYIALSNENFQGTKLISFSGDFLFTGTSGLQTGTVAYVGQYGTNSAISGTGTYSISTTCAVTVNMTWTVFAVAIPNVVYNLYAETIDTVPVPSKPYELEGLMSVSMAATNKITLTSGWLSGPWVLKRQNK